VSKHDFVPDATQKKQLAFLRGKKDIPWAAKLATCLEGYMQKADHGLRAYEAEQQSMERAAIVLESYNRELQLIHVLLGEIVRNADNCTDFEAFVHQLPGAIDAVRSVHTRGLDGLPVDDDASGSVDNQTGESADDCPI
jgi:hypothetical protein